MTNKSLLYRIFWLSSAAELIPWQDPLNQFFQAVQSQNRFADWTQLQNYLHYFEQSQILRLCLVTTPDYHIQGALLLKQSRRPTWLQRVCQLLDGLGNKPDTTDANDVLVHPDADFNQVVPLLGNALVNAPFTWHWLNWSFLQNDSHAACLAQTLTSRVHHVRLTADMPRPLLTLPTTEADYLKQRSSRVKKFVNNKQNRLGRDFPNQMPGLRWIEPSDTAKWADWFFPTYLAYWDKQHVKTEFHRHPNLVGFYRDCLKTGLLKMTGYFVGDEIACAFIGYDLPNNGYLLHLTCFNAKYAEYSPGILHNDAIIKSLIEKQYRLLDFGLGDLEYKSYFTKAKLPTWQLQAFRTPLSYGAYTGMARLKSLIKAGRTRQTVKLAEPETPAQTTD